MKSLTFMVFSFLDAFRLSINSGFSSGSKIISSNCCAIRFIAWLLSLRLCLALIMLSTLFVRSSISTIALTILTPY